MVKGAVNLLGFSRAKLQEFLLSIDENPKQAPKLLKWIHRRQVTDFSKMSDLSLRLQKKLQAQAMVALPQLRQETRAKDGVFKWLLSLNDHKAIETVYIPENDRGTLCISSQVGCSLNCSFCATAKMDFGRNLRVEEVVGQLAWAIQRLQKPITNVVLMGMGEPLLNYQAVLQAIELMLDDCAYGLSKYRVTLSTAGLVPALQRLRDDSRVSLAISLHAPNNALRDQLVPLNKKFPLETLIPICRHYFPQKSKQKILFEYVMLAGVNDQLHHAEELSVLIKEIPCKVNLIPFNPFPGTDYVCSDEHSIQEFQDFLIQKNIPTWVRRTRGDEIYAACGQLAGE
jgi:23S rRNA (adenine2503-C2)-methyltransferase